MGEEEEDDLMAFSPANGSEADVDDETEKSPQGMAAGLSPPQVAISDKI